jgi:hypothetical protein
MIKSYKESLKDLAILYLSISPHFTNTDVETLPGWCFNQAQLFLNEECRVNGHMFSSLFQCQKCGFKGNK